MPEESDPEYLRRLEAAVANLPNRSREIQSPPQSEVLARPPCRAGMLHPVATWEWTASSARSGQRIWTGLLLEHPAAEGKHRPTAPAVHLCASCNRLERTSITAIAARGGPGFVFRE